MLQQHHSSLNLVDKSFNIESYSAFFDQTSSTVEETIMTTHQSIYNEKRSNNNDSFLPPRSFGSSPSQYIPRPLPSTFQRNNFTVIIGRCKEAKSCIGNKRLRILASSYLARYANPHSRNTKTEIVTEVRDTIFQAKGHFIQKKDDGEWYMADDGSVREKIGYVLRDLLSDRYKSSAKSKAAARRRRREEDAKEESVFCCPSPSQTRSFVGIPTTFRRQHEMNERRDSCLLPDTTQSDLPSHKFGRESAPLFLTPLSTRGENAKTTTRTVSADFETLEHTKKNFLPEDLKLSSDVFRMGNKYQQESEELMLEEKPEEDQFPKSVLNFEIDELYRSPFLVDPAEKFLVDSSRC